MAQWITGKKKEPWEEYIGKIVNIKESVGIWALELIQYLSDKNISQADLKKMTESE